MRVCHQVRDALVPQVTALESALWPPRIPISMIDLPSISLLQHPLSYLNPLYSICLVLVLTGPIFTVVLKFLVL